MATLQARLTDLAAAIRSKINLMVPRLLPGGGSEGQVLAKSASGDFQVAWTTLAQVKGFAGGVAGKPAGGQLVGGGIAPYSFTLSAANSTAIANTAATSSTVFIIKRNGAQIGTITFSASATVGIVSFTQTSVSAGQRVEIYAPATPDATLADILFLLRE